jgi:hypothetical protein
VLVAGFLELSDAPAAFLREIRRVAAPAARVALIVPRRRFGFANVLPGQRYSRARLDRLLVEARLEPVDWRVFGGVYLVRARPCGGPGPAVARRGAPVLRAATA